MFKQKKPVEQGLQIIIVGCGKVGQTLIAQLIKEGHNITLIDKNQQKIQELTNLYDVMGVVGNGASFSVQKEADIDHADLIIAVTDSDELNLLCCTVAKRVGNCSAIARVRTPDYSMEANYLRERLGLAMIINPELEASREMARILYLPTALEVDTFAHGQAEMIKFKVPEENLLDGMMVADLGKTVGRNIADNVLICAVERDSEIYIPSGNVRILRGDCISFVSTRRDAKSFLEKIGFKTHAVKNTMIIGGGKSSYYLASQLLHMGISVKIIDSNPKRCEELSILLPRAVIINGDGTNEELLREEGIEYVESFVPLTGIDEENILLTLHARHVSHAKVITKINRTNYKGVLGGLNMDSVIYPRYIASEAIVAYVRAKKASMNSSNIETLYHMFDFRVEAIEFRVKSESPVTNIPLAQLSLKKGLLISFINRRGTIIIPSGQDSIQVGDTVMIVTTHTGFKVLQDILND